MFYDVQTVHISICILALAYYSFTCVSIWPLTIELEYNMIMAIQYQNETSYYDEVYIRY